MIEPSIAYAHHVNWKLPDHPVRRRVLHILPLRFLAPDCWLIGGLTTEQAAVYYQHLVRSAKGQDGVANVLSAQGTCLGSEVKPISLAIPKARSEAKKQTSAGLFKDELRERFRHALLGPCRGATWDWRKQNGLTPEQYTVSQRLPLKWRGDINGQDMDRALDKLGALASRRFVCSPNHSHPKARYAFDLQMGFTEYGYRASLFYSYRNDSSCWAVTQYSRPVETFYEFTIRATEGFEQALAAKKQPDLRQRIALDDQQYSAHIAKRAPR